MLLTRHLGEGGWWFLFAIAVIGIAVPYCNLAFQPGDPFYVSGFMVSLIGKFLTYALLALAIDLIWGYCGILSLGHGAFFALGGYAMGMYLMRQIGDRGVYAHPVLPTSWSSQLDGAPLVLVGLRQFPVRHAHGAAGAGHARLRLRLAGVPLTGHRRLFLDHHPGHDLCLDAGLLPQRHGLRRQ
jgi:ABC-type branched-subunit amino acid transport system permease subunit